jgi:hypothetical protein
VNGNRMSWVQNRDLIGDNIRSELTKTLVIFPRPRLKPAFDVNLLALANIPVANFGQITPGDDIKPFRFLTTLAVRSGPPPADCDAK